MALSRFLRGKGDGCVEVLVRCGVGGERREAAARGLVQHCDDESPMQQADADGDDRQVPAFTLARTGVGGLDRGALGKV